MATKFEQKLEELKRKYGGGGAPEQVATPSASSTPTQSSPGGMEAIQSKLFKRLGIATPAAPAQTPMPDSLADVAAPITTPEPEVQLETKRAPRYPKVSDEQTFNNAPVIVTPDPAQYLSERATQAAKAVTPATVSEFGQYQKAQDMKPAERYRLAIDIGEGKVKVTELEPAQIPWDQLFSQPMYGQIAAVGMKDPAQAYPLLVEMQNKLTGTPAEKQSILPPSFGAGFAEGVGESASLGMSRMAPGRTPAEKTGQFVGQVAGALPGVLAAASTGGAAAGGLATRLAPQLVKSLAGRMLASGVAAAGTGATYQAAREGAQAVARPEEADLKRSAQNIASTTGTYALFGALSPVSSKILGGTGRLIANKVPGGQALARSVSNTAKQYPTVAKGMEGAAEGLLTGGMYGTVMGGVDAVRDPEARSMKAFVQSAAQNAGEEFSENIIEALVLGLAQKWVPVNTKAVVDAGLQIQAEVAKAETSQTPRRDVLKEGLAVAEQVTGRMQPIWPPGKPIATDAPFELDPYDQALAKSQQQTLDNLAQESQKATEVAVSGDGTPAQQKPSTASVDPLEALFADRPDVAKVLRGQAQQVTLTNGDVALNPYQVSIMEDIVDRSGGILTVQGNTLRFGGEVKAPTPVAQPTKQEITPAPKSNTRSTQEAPKQAVAEPESLAATVDLPGAEVGAPVLSSQLKKPAPKPFGDTVKVGDKVTVDGRKGIFEVVDTKDPSLLRVKTASGAELPVGRATVKPVEQTEMTKGEPSPVDRKPAQKEPWQMTRAEFDARWMEDVRRDLEEEVTKKVNATQSEISRLNSVIASNPDNPANATLRANVEQLQGEIAKQQERLNAPIVAPSAFMSESKLRDYRGVDEAANAGKQLPPEVLADYPDLQTKKAPATQQKGEEDTGTVKDTLRSKVDAQEGTGVADTRMGILPDALRGTVKLGQPVKQTADVPMENAKAEERFQNAKNRPPGESSLQQVKTWWGTVKQHLTSDLPYLPGGQRYAKLAFKLRQLSKGRGTASDRAVFYLQGITTNLKRDEYNLFSRAVVYADMLEDVNRGLYDTDTELAFGLTPDELRREHARVMAAVEQNEQVKQSLADRKAVMQEVRTTYAALYEKVNGKPLPWNREDYFHHEVLNRLGVTPARVNGTGQTVQTQKAGWMKARKGTSYDFLTNYLEAEHKVIAEMLYGIKVHQLIDFVNQTENLNYEDKTDNPDKRVTLREEAKRLSEKTGQKVKWKSLIPEGYRLWQPDPGNFMFRATALDARVVDEIMNSDLEEATATIDDIRSVLVIGGKKMEFVIPTEVADTLDHFSRSKPLVVNDALDGAVRKVMTAWKKHQLLFLTRAFKYNVRNLTGDVDALVSANPGALKKTGRAVAELHNFLIRGGAPTAELEAWMDRGGMQDVLGIAEGVTQIDALKQFRRVSEQPSVKQMLESGDVAGVAKKFSSKYAWVAKYTNLREYTLRYAAFLDYVDQIQKNGKPDNWGASVREEVQALEDPYDMAYELSNDLLGAYDKVSVAGQWVRERFIPFWSWNEVNVRRYKHLIENAVRDGLTVEKVGKATASKFARVAVKSPLIAYNLGKFALKAHALTAMLSAWNYLLFREEEEELPESVRAKPHIIFGRDEDGKVIYFNRLGAIADFYEWFGLDGSTRYVKDYLNGRTTLKEIAIDMAMSPVNKLVQGLGPSKTAVETLLGKTMYPDVSKPRTIRDKGEFLADSVALGDAYRLAFGKPTRGAGEIVRNMFTYRIDPQEVAYSEMVGAKYEWLKKKKGMGDPGGPISPKSNALYYFKQALRYGDEEAANKYLRKYVEYGGTSKGLNQSLKALHPLYGMSREEAAAFVGQLNEKEKDQLRTAIEFYGKVLSGDVGN